MSLVTRMKAMMSRGKTIEADPSDIDRLAVIERLSSSIFDEKPRLADAPSRRLSTKGTERPRTKARIKRKRLRQLTRAARQANR